MMSASLENQKLPKTLCVNSACKISTMNVGEEGNTIVIVDDYLSTPDDVVHLAKIAGHFVDERDNFYPGKRKDVPQDYSHILADFFRANIASLFEINNATPEVVESKFCIATKPPSELIPIQSIPHFDTSDDNQIAAVHYLCRPPFQGTSFYQHRSSGFEAITADKSKSYYKWLNREATTIGLPKADYIMGDTQAFKRIAKIELKENRIIFYKSNMLHAGDINAQTDLQADPTKGRLTANSFIRF